MKLTGDQIERIVKALMSAFDKDSLKMMVRYQLNETLTDFVQEGPFEAMTFGLVEAWGRRRPIDQLIKGARRANPGNPDLEEVEKEIAISHSPGPVPLPEVQKLDSSTGETKPAIPSQPKQHAPPDPDVHIGRELHWDREFFASTFLEMIKQAEENPWRVLGLQGSKDADLDSLIERFEEMCRKVKIPEAARYPRIFTRVLLRSGLGTPPTLALEILDNLARNATDPGVRGEKARLEEGFDDIEQSSRGTGMQSLSDIQLSRKLTRCLEDVTKTSTVVLLLQRFEELNESVAKWLRDEWLPSYACRIDRLVIVITGETLDKLAKLEPKGIYCPDRLPPMTWQDFWAWARESDEYRFGDWFTEDLARKYHQQCNGNPQGFKSILKTLKIAIENQIPIFSN